MTEQQFGPSDISVAESYQRYIVPGIFDGYTAALIEAVALQHGERVLDIACGSGVATRAAAGCGGVVIGLDADPAMLEVARGLPSQGAPIEWHLDDAQALPFAAGTIDVALCQQGLQFFPNRMGSLREMHRVLVAGGRLGISVSTALQRSPGMASIAEALGRHVGQQAATFVTRGIFGLSDAEELYTLIASTGFGDVMVRSIGVPTHFASVEQFVAAIMRVGPLAAMTDASVDDATRAAIVSEVGSALQDYVTDAGCSFPIYINLAVAYK